MHTTIQMRIGIHDVYGCSALYSHFGLLNTCSYLHAGGGGGGVIMTAFTRGQHPRIQGPAFEIHEPGLLASLQEMLYWSSTLHTKRLVGSVTLS